MAELLFQKTSTSELWWIGSALALMLTAWLLLTVYRYLKRRLTHQTDITHPTDALKH